MVNKQVSYSIMLSATIDRARSSDRVRNPLGEDQLYPRASLMYAGNETSTNCQSRRRNANSSRSYIWSNKSLSMSTEKKSERKHINSKGKKSVNINITSRILTRKQPRCVSLQGGANMNPRSLVIGAMAILCVGCCSAMQTLQNQPQQHVHQPIQQQQQPLPDSIYKVAPLLFGVDIIPDYFTEPAAVIPRAPDLSPPPPPPPLPPTQMQHPQGLMTNNNGKAGNQMLAQTAMQQHNQQQQHQASMQGKQMTTKGELMKSSRIGELSPQAPIRASGKGASHQDNRVHQRQPMSNNGHQDSAGGKNSALGANQGQVSMDHVISSLGLVVEAMKQQTMAMQMISGQMAGTKSQVSPSTSSVTPGVQAMANQMSGSGQTSAETRALLESFGELMGQFRGARAAGVKTLQLDSFGEPILPAIKGNLLRQVNGIAGNSNLEEEQPVLVTQERAYGLKGIETGGYSTPSSTSSTTTTTTTSAPSTTSTTTTTTARPTTPSTTTTTTTTTAAPTSTTSTTTTTAKPVYSTTLETSSEMPPRYAIAPVLSNSKTGVVGGWRRVVPFDFYPNQDANGDHFGATQVAGSAKGSVSGVYGSFGQAMGENFRSVGYLPQNGGLRPMGLNAIPSQADLMEIARQVMIMQQQQEPNIQQYTSGGSSYRTPQGGPAPPRVPDGPSPGQMIAQMMLSSIDHQQQQAAKETQMWRPHSNDVAMHMSMGSGPSASDDSNVSDEIPKPPAVNLHAQANGATKTSPGRQSANLKIGERPPFDMANFHLLNDNPQKKLVPMMKVSPLKSSMFGVPSMSPVSPIQVEQPESVNDLSGHASSQIGDWAKNSGSSGSSTSSTTEQPSAVEQGPQRPSAVRPPTHIGPPAPLQVAQSAQSGGHKPTSFSILGGRFKITPHTQMLHYLLEPSKVLLQQALGQLMPPSGPPMSVPKAPRKPRRGQKATKPAASKASTSTSSSAAASSNSSSSSSSSSSTAPRSAANKQSSKKKREQPNQ